MKNTIAILALLAFAACGDTSSLANSAGGGAGSSTDSGPSAQERADRTFGNDRDRPDKTPVEQVSVSNDTTPAVGATGNGGQSAGDDVPTRTVKEEDLGGTPASPGGGDNGEADSGAGEADSGVTENGNEAPAFD